MVHRLFDPKARWTILLTAVFVVAVACGESAKRSGSSAPSTHAGESGAGTGDTGSGGGSGTAGTGTSGEGGEPSGGGVSGAGRGGAPMAGQGGSPVAGASSGGTTGGAGATSVVTPDGCTLDSHLLGGLYCSMAMTCGSETVLISCQEDAGDWRCGCVNGNVRPDFYYFPDVTGLRTCEISAAVCLEPELLDGDEDCTLADATTSSSCTATETCVRSHTVDGIALETRSSWSASCEICSTSSDACCECAETHIPDYRLVASDIADGCLYLDELCRRSDDVTLGTGSCETLGETTNDVSCDVDTRCEYPLRLADGTTLIQPTNLQTHCNTYDYPEPVTQCRCTDDDGWDMVNVRFDPLPPDITMCRSTSQACAGLASIEPTGDLACTEYAEETSPADRFCRRQRSCLQPATLLGTAVRTVWGALVDCNLRDNGKWFCNCFYAEKGEELVTLELDADDSESACTEAIAECPLVSRAVY